jgi:hypothetical protein
VSLIALAVIAGLLLFILLAYQVLLWNRPPRTDHTELLFQGVTYTRQARSIPRPLMVHAVKVDLSAPGIAVVVTPGDASKGMEVLAATTSEFVTEFGVQVAINGSFFEPFYSQGYTDYYPQSGDPVDVRGLAISDGVMYSADEASYAKLCLAGAYAQITAASCPSDTAQALAGDHMIVEGGERGDLGPPGYPDALHPRTAVAVDAEGKSLWLIVVDGRQDGYSEGVSLAELADIAIELGVDTALNLDGGGSSALVITGAWGPRALNSPIHTRMPSRQRPVANHLGVYALPAQLAR